MAARPGRRGDRCRRAGAAAGPPGRNDGYGNELEVAVTAVADQLASAAELVKGKCDRVPVAVVRGWRLVTEADGPGAGALVRGPAEGLFPLGTDEALTVGRALGAVSATGQPPPATGRVCCRLLVPGPAPQLPAAVAARLPAGTAAVVAVTGQTADDPGTAEIVERLLAVLATGRLAGRWIPLDAAERASMGPLRSRPGAGAGPGDAGIPVGLLAVIAGQASSRPGTGSDSGTGSGSRHAWGSEVHYP